MSLRTNVIGEAERGQLRSVGQLWMSMAPFGSKHMKSGIILKKIIQSLYISQPECDYSLLIQIQDVFCIDLDWTH